MCLKIDQEVYRLHVKLLARFDHQITEASFPIRCRTPSRRAPATVRRRPSTASEAPSSAGSSSGGSRTTRRRRCTTTASRTWSKPHRRTYAPAVPNRPDTATPGPHRMVSPPSTDDRGTSTSTRMPLKYKVSDILQIMNFDTIFPTSIKFTKGILGKALQSKNILVARAAVGLLKAPGCGMLEAEEVTYNSTISACDKGKQ